MGNINLKDFLFGVITGLLIAEILIITVNLYK